MSVSSAPRPLAPDTTAPASLSLQAAEALLGAPVLPPDPFAGQITACNRLVLGYLTAWAEAAREAARAALARLSARRAPAEEWELAALGTAVHEWRVLSGFRALHERARCPGLLFRLQTRTDFLTLCNRRQDSGAGGYGERERRVLSRRGIACRRSWAAARALVAEVGLLDAPPVQPAEGGSVAAPPPPDSPESPEAADPNEGGGEEPGPGPEKARAARLPALAYSPVWHTLGGLTKAGLAAVAEEYGVGLWAQFGRTGHGPRFYGSMRRAEMLEYVRRVVRCHAALAAAWQLDERGVERLFDWMQSRFAGAHLAGAQQDSDLAVAARLFGDLMASADLGMGGHTFASEAWNRHRDAELRRIGAFCYGAFYDSLPRLNGEAVAREASAREGIESGARP